jgi:hypothetical protein
MVQVLSPDTIKSCNKHAVIHAECSSLKFVTCVSVWPRQLSPACTTASFDKTLNPTHLNACHFFGPGYNEQLLSRETVTTEYSVHYSEHCPFRLKKHTQQTQLIIVNQAEDLSLDGSIE